MSRLNLDSRLGKASIDLGAFGILLLVLLAIIGWIRKRSGDS